MRPQRGDWHGGWSLEARDLSSTEGKGLAGPCKPMVTVKLLGLAWDEVTNKSVLPK